MNNGSIPPGGDTVPPETLERWAAEDAAWDTATADFSRDCVHKARMMFPTVKEAGAFLMRCQESLDALNNTSGKDMAAPRGAVSARRLTDAGNALRLVDQHGADVRYVPKWQSWFIWSGQRWTKDDRGEMVERAKETARTLYSEAASEESEGRRKALGDWAKQSEGASRIEAMVKLARSDPRVVVSHEDFDRHPYLLNVANGTLDLRTGALREPCRDDLLTKRIPTAFEPDAEAPTWERFLGEVMQGNAEMVGFLRRAVGYSLTGDTSERVLLFLHGGGKNGKSTFLEAVAHVLTEDYAMVTPSETVMAKKPGGPTNDIARLKGARFVSTSETEDGRKLATAAVKRITGGDKLVARFLYGEHFEFVPEFKVWAASNFKPVVSANDQALWDRLRLVPFVARFETPDKGLLGKLTAEAPGILAWAVRGCLEWQRDGLGLPAEVEAATAAYREEVDALGDFLVEKCVRVETAKVKVGALYEAYEGWCRSNGEDTVKQRKFNEELVRRGFRKGVSTGGFIWWFGLGLAVEQLTSDDSESETSLEKPSHGVVDDPRSTQVNYSTHEQSFLRLIESL